MSSLMRPVGPQQPGVYWFRRGLLLLVVVLIFVGIGYLLFGRGSGTTPVADPSSSTSPATTPSATPSPSVKPSATTSVKPSPSTSAKPSGTPKPSPSTSAVTRACTDSDITLLASTDASTYKVGATPKLQMKITNSSSTSCRRSVGSAANELIVYDGTTRFWSSDDCNPGGANDPVTISPGQSYSVSVTWAGIGSSVNCPSNPPKAAAGSYTLVGVNQNQRSKAAPFTLTAAG